MSENVQVVETEVKAEKKFVKPGLAWGLVAGVFVVAVAVALIVILPLV